MARVEKATGPAATAGRPKATGSGKAPPKPAQTAAEKGAAARGASRATATVPVSGTKRAKPADPKPKPVAAAGKRTAERAVVAAAATKTVAKHSSKAAPKAAPPPRPEPKAAPKSKAETKPASKAAPRADAKAKAGPASAKAPEKATTAKASVVAGASPAVKPAAKGLPAHGHDGAKVTSAPARKAQPRGRSEPLDKFLAEQRQLLLEERSTHLVQAESLKEEADALAAEMEPGESEFGEEGGEGGNLSIERELDLVLSAQAKAAVDEIERALAKIEAGTYGLCEKCGREIPKARLKVLPHAPLCVACKSGGLSRR